MPFEIGIDYINPDGFRISLHPEPGSTADLWVALNEGQSEVRVKADAQQLADAMRYVLELNASANPVPPEPPA